MPEPLFMIGVLSAAAGKLISGKGKSVVLGEAIGDSIRELSSLVMNKGYAGAKKFLHKDGVPVNDLLDKPLHEAKLMATQFLMAPVLDRIDFLEALVQPVYPPGTARSLGTAYKKWHHLQATDQHYSPYLPGEQAGLEKINQLVLQKDEAVAGSETVKVVKGHFHTELSYGLKLHGFLQDIPEEIGQFLFLGWELEGKLVDWFEILTLHFANLLKDPAHEKARKAFEDMLLADIKSDTRALREEMTGLLQLLGDQDGLKALIDKHAAAMEQKLDRLQTTLETGLKGLEGRLEELSAKVSEALPVGTLRNSDEVTRLLGRKAELDALVSQRWTAYQAARQTAQSNPSEENIDNIVTCKGAWQEADKQQKDTEKELGELEQFIRSTGRIFARMDMDKASSRLREAKQYFEEGDFIKVRETLSADQREAEREALLRQDAALQLQRKNFAAEDLLHAQAILIDFSDPDRYTKAGRVFGQSIQTYEGYDNCFDYAAFLHKLDRYREAIDYFEKALARVDGEKEEQLNRVILLNDIGSTYRTLMEYDKAKERHLTALAFSREFYQEDPGKYGVSLASTIRYLGRVYEDFNNLNEAEECYMEALDLYRQQPESDISQDAIASVLKVLAVFYKNTRQINEAGQYAREALTIRRKIAEKYADNYDIGLADALITMGHYYVETEQTKEAETCFREAFEISKAYNEQNPGIFDIDVAEALRDIALVYERGGHLTEALETYLEAHALLLKLATNNPHPYQRCLADTVCDLGQLYMKLDRQEDAEKNLLEALALYRELADKNPTVFRKSIAGILDGVSQFYGEAEKWSEAELYRLESIEIYREIRTENPGPEDRDLAIALANLALICHHTDRKIEAESYAREALAIMLECYKKDPWVLEKLLYMLFGLAEMLLDRDEPKTEEARGFLLTMAELMWPNRHETYLGKIMELGNESLKTVGLSLEQVFTELSARQGGS